MENGTGGREARERAERLVSAGETVYWAGEHGRSTLWLRYALAGATLVPVALFFYFVVTSSRNPAAGGHGTPVWFVGFASLMLAIAAWSVWRRMHADAEATYVVTDSRVLVDGREPKTFNSDSIEYLRVRPHLLTRRADVWFREEAYGRGESAGVRRYGFRGIADPHAAAQALLRLKPDLPVQPQSRASRAAQWAGALLAVASVASLANSLADGVALERRWIDTAGREVIWATNGWAREVAAAPAPNNVLRGKVEYDRRSVTPWSGSSSRSGDPTSGMPVGEVGTRLVIGLSAVRQAEAAARERQDAELGGTVRQAAEARTPAQFNAAGDEYQKRRLLDEALPLFEKAATHPDATPRERAYALASRMACYNDKMHYVSALREARRVLETPGCPPEIARVTHAKRVQYENYLKHHRYPPYSL